MKLKIALGGLFALLIAARIALPAYMLKKTNDFLADYSKVFVAHIDDIDISFFRMAYRFEGISVKLRQDDFEPLSVGSVDVSLAWRELLRLRILTDIEVKDARVKINPKVSQALTAAADETAAKGEKPADNKKAGAAPEQETIQAKLFPLRIERVDVIDSYADYSPGVDTPAEKRFVMDQTQIRVSNINPNKAGGKTVASFQSRLMNNAKLKGVAQARRAPERTDWDIDAEVRDFRLVQANPFLLEALPFTFTEGNLDVFMEAKSEKGAVIGYIKPFFKNVDVIARKEKFQSVKHFFIEIGVALGNVILQKPKFKSLATKLDFTKAGPGAEFKIDTLGALSNAVEHRLDQPIAPNVEDEIVLK